MDAPDSRTLDDRVTALSYEERTWVLYWLAYDPDPVVRAVLEDALDHQAIRSATVTTVLPDGYTSPPGLDHHPPAGVCYPVVDEPSQADVERAWPQWKTWRGTDRLCHALRRHGAALTATGEDWEDLSHEITRAESLLEDARPVAWRS